MARRGRGLRLAAWITVPLGAALMVGALLLAKSGYTTVIVSSAAMEPTYSPGRQLVVDRVPAARIRRGDVVLFQMPDRYSGGAVLERAIGLGGDHVVERLGAPVTVNGRPLAEPYVKHGDPSGGGPDFA